MFDKTVSPKEGDLYKIIQIDEHRFELRFGYYADFERSIGDPVVIYPDLIKKRLYTKDGKMIATAVQEPCQHYNVPDGVMKNDNCEDCIYYSEPSDEIGICLCEQNRRE